MALDDKTRAVYLKMWSEDFADVDDDRLAAAFVACRRSHPFRTMPTIADVRQHLSKAEENATRFEAEQKWERVLAYAARLNPDIPDRNPPRISEPVKNAIRAAGGLNYIRDCGLESLQWACKRFVESYVRHFESKQDQFLLPEGPLRNAITDVAAIRQLPKAG
jgi:hypothetical protein